MDTRTGEVMEWEEMKKRIDVRPHDAKYYREVPAQVARVKTSRNEPCPCGSGKKFKKCCLDHHV